jgi:hypothetical protein
MNPALDLHQDATMEQQLAGLPFGNPDAVRGISGRLSATATPQPTNAWHVAGTPWLVARGEARPAYLHKTPPGWTPHHAEPTTPVFRILAYDDLGGEPLVIEVRSPKDRQFYKVESRLEVRP